MMMMMRKGHVQGTARKLKVKKTLVSCQQHFEGHWNLLRLIGLRIKSTRLCAKRAVAPPPFSPQMERRPIRICSASITLF